MGLPSPPPRSAIAASQTQARETLQRLCTLRALEMLYRVPLDKLPHPTDMLIDSFCGHDRELARDYYVQGLVSDRFGVALQNQPPPAIISGASARDGDHNALWFIVKRDGSVVLELGAGPLP